MEVLESTSSGNEDSHISDLALDRCTEKMGQDGVVEGDGRERAVVTT